MATQPRNASHLLIHFGLPEKDPSQRNEISNFSYLTDSRGHTIG
jgi:hypothetical protein